MQRFYGGDPERWFHIPGWQFWMYVRALERLDAEEAIEGIVRHRMGAGLLKDSEHRQMARELEFRRRGRQLEAGARPKSMDALKQIAGIKVVEE